VYRSKSKALFFVSKPCKTTHHTLGWFVVGRGKPNKKLQFQKKSTQKKAASGHEKQMYYPIGEHFCFFLVLPGLPDSGHEKQMYHIGPNRPEARFDSDSQEGKAEFVVGRSKAQLV
jgi:hypothetical protein